MEWFNKWFAKKCKEAWENGQRGQANQAIPVPTGWNSTVGKLGNSIDRNSLGNLNFSIHKATGGSIVEIKRYDLATDRYDSSLHIIPADAELGESIGKIITYESLKN